AAVRQTGADRGCILRWEGDDCQVDAYIDSRSAGRDHFEYAASVSRAVRLTGRPVSLVDAARSPYIRDPYIRQSQTASLVCMSIGPAVGSKAWLLYLEHTQVTGV